jgi:hypothetical protein
VAERAHDLIFASSTRRTIEGLKREYALSVPPSDGLWPDFLSWATGRGVQGGRGRVR